MSQQLAETTSDATSWKWVAHNQNFIKAQTKKVTLCFFNKLIITKTNNNKKKSMWIRQKEKLIRSIQALDQIVRFLPSLGQYKFGTA